MTVRRFRLLFAAVSLMVLAPLAVLVQRALQSAGVERQMRHRAVAERVFDEMERALSGLLEREERRAFESYGPSPGEALEPFVAGYFEIDPAGHIRARPADGSGDTASHLEGIVGAYWRGGAGIGGGTASGPPQQPGTTVDLGSGAVPAAAKMTEAAAGREQVSAFDALRSLNRAAEERAERQKKDAGPSAPAGASPAGRSALAARDEHADDTAAAPADLAEMALRAAGPEPMTGRLLGARHLMLYRTVLRDARGYRQGVVLDVERLADWLRQQGLGNDGLAAQARLAFATPLAGADRTSGEGPFVYQHRFAEPFDDLTARLALRPLPGAGGAYLYALAALVVAVTGIGLVAIYRMVAVAMAYAERRTNFVAAVSHELKTPLTAIRMYGEMLRDGIVPSAEKRDEYHRHITAEAERLSRLINNVLELGHLEQGTRPLALATGSVVPVVREAADLLGPHASSQGFALEVDVAGDLPPVRFEPDALMQVLCNLVDNALKYARDASPRRIALRGWADRDGVHLAVRDHGPGVPPRHLGKIFEPFYRAESELTRRSKGAGIGLALVRGLVERMGARVDGRNLADGFEVEIAFEAAPGG